MYDYALRYVHKVDRHVRLCSHDCIYEINYIFASVQSARRHQPASQPSYRTGIGRVRKTMKMARAFWNGIFDDVNGRINELASLRSGKWTGAHTHTHSVFYRFPWPPQRLKRVLLSLGSSSPHWMCLCAMRAYHFGVDVWAIFVSPCHSVSAFSSIHTGGIAPGWGTLAELSDVTVLRSHFTEMYAPVFIWNTGFRCEFERATDLGSRFEDFIMLMQWAGFD